MTNLSSSHGKKYSSSKRLSHRKRKILGRKREATPLVILFNYTKRKTESQKEHATPSRIDTNLENSMTFCCKSNEMGVGLQLNKKKNQEQDRRKKKKSTNKEYSLIAKQGTGYGNFCYIAGIHISFLFQQNARRHLTARQLHPIETGDRDAAFFANHRRYGTDDKGRKANKKTRILPQLPIW